MDAPASLRTCVEITPSSRRSYGDNITLMAWGARLFDFHTVQNSDEVREKDRVARPAGRRLGARREVDDEAATLPRLDPF